MADEDDPMVTISGPALAMLLYENSRTTDQIGFFLGEVLQYVTKKVTDSDRDVEQIKYHINIKSLVAYPLSEPFFNSAGEIIISKLEKFLGDKMIKQVVGWYHYRDECPIRPTYRDNKLHNGLAKFFSKFSQLYSEWNFIFCVLNSHSTEIGGTHKFKQLLLRKKSSDDFSPVSLKINNLGADATRPDGSDYKLTPKFSSCKSDAFDGVYTLIKDDLKTAGSNVQTVKLIENAAQTLLSKLITKVEKSDREVSQLEAQLQKLREEKYHNIFEKAMLEVQVRQMDVDARSDSKTPDLLPGSLSPNMFDDSPKKSIPSGSHHRSSATRSFNQELDQAEYKRGNASPSQSSTLPRTSGSRGSPSSRFYEQSSGSSSPNTLERNRNLRSGKQKSDVFSEPSSSAMYNSSRKSIHQSTEHVTNNDS